MADEAPSKIRRLKHLEAFSAVLSTGSMSEAAKQLGVSQPAISQMIRKLEGSIGAPLFVRRNGAVFPTSRAESLRDDAAELLSQIDKIQMQLSHGQTNLLSTIRMSASQTITNEILPTLLQEIHREHPSGAFYVNSLPLANMVSAVAQGHVDFAFNTRQLSHPNLCNDTLVEVPQVCVMPANHALAHKDKLEISDLQHQRVVSPSRQDPAYQYYREFFLRHRVQIDQVLQSPFAGFSMRMLRGLDAISFHSALIAELYCRRNPEVVWRRLPGLEATTTFYLAYAGWLSESETLKLVRSSFFASLGGLLESIEKFR